jgi:hypothetical protein
MSNSKKAWNASKAKKRAGDATKKSIKVNALEAKERQRRVIKGRA